MMSQDDNDMSIWDLYRKQNLSTPRNVSQLMRWTKQTDHVKSLRFFEAKKIFKCMLYLIIIRYNNNNNIDIKIRSKINGKG